MARKATLVQLDGAQVAALDERAAREGRSRSQLVREAVDALLGRGDAAALDRALLAGYERRPPAAPDALAVQAALASIAAEPW